MVDSHLPRFSQAIQALLLGIAFAFDLRPIVPALALILAAAVAWGPRANPFAYLYRALPIPRGEPEPAAPPRFAQTLGTIFLTIATIGLYGAEAETTLWWALGWGPALLVAALCVLAASTALCVGCEMYLLMQRARARRA